MNRDTQVEQAAAPQNSKSMTVFSRAILLYGFALAAAAIIAISTGFIQSNYRFILIPLIGFGAIAGFNLLTGVIACTNPPYVAGVIRGLYAIGTLAATLIAVHAFSFMNYPIRALLPSSDADTQILTGRVFYMFWAAFYTQLITSGMMQTCAAA